MKIEADTDSMIDYPHDDMPVMGIFLFIYFFSLCVTIFMFLPMTKNLYYC